jgi:hypothetical protein
MTDQFRIFVRDTCSKIVTYELKAEQDARSRRTSRAKADGTKARKAGASLGNQPSDRQRKHFNIETYKFHAIGDYVDNIRLLGTTDSYSTELVSGLQLYQAAETDCSLRVKGSIATPRLGSSERTKKTTPPRSLGSSVVELVSDVYETNWTTIIANM